MSSEFSFNTVSTENMACQTNPKTDFLANPWVDAAIAAGVVVGAALLLKSRALPEVKVAAEDLLKDIRAAQSRPVTSGLSAREIEDAAIRKAIEEAHLHPSNEALLFKAAMDKARQEASQFVPSMVRGASGSRSASFSKTLEERLAAARPAANSAEEVVQPPPPVGNVENLTPLRGQEIEPWGQVIEPRGKVVQPRPQSIEDLFKIGKGSRYSQ